MKQYVKDLIKSETKFKVKPSSKEVHVKIQKAFFEEGIGWKSSKKVVQDYNGSILFKDGVLLTDSSDCQEVPEADILSSLPEGGFQVGDKVRAFGVDGEVISTSGQWVRVKFSSGDIHTFYHDGKDLSWHKEPSLTFISRPIRTIKHKFYIWSCNGKVHTEVMDESMRNINGAPQARNPGAEWKKMEGTMVELEVEAKLFTINEGSR